MWDAASIIAEAQAQVGVDDPESNVHRNLERLIESLTRQSGMSAEGFERTRRHLIANTVHRLEGLKWLGDYPEIAAEPIAAPVFLMGLPRSGTTYFQYVFDRDARFRQIRSWESLTPSPPPAFDPASAARRRSQWAELRRREHPSFEGFDAMHLLDEDGSDECHAFLQQSFGAAGLNNIFRVPSYFDYLLDELDLVQTYEVHKRQLQLLQWRTPRRPWVVKYPNHVLAMREILQVYPDAVLVMTHRDPVQVVASISKMTAKLRATRTAGPVDPVEVGRDMLHFIARHIDRILQFDRGEQGRRVIHLDYYAILDDPLTAIRQIHERLGVDSAQQVCDAVTAWRQANPKNSRGRNDYTIEQYGLDASAIAERFSDYMRRFDIPRERAGLARGRP
jgi:hypothetical protein